MADKQAATAATTQQAPPVYLQLQRLADSPFNPRTDYAQADLERMAQSVREHGVLQPLLVRPKAGKGGTTHEIVFGHRRKRAAALAGLQQVPCYVEDLDDATADERQAVENHQRADLHPLDEADQLRRINVVHKRSVEEIAKRIGLSREYVYARLKLAELGDKGRAAFRSGQLVTSTALMLARVPAGQVQDRAVAEIAARAAEGQPMGAREVLDHIQRRYMLRLAEAPFRTDDAQLVPAAGACNTCPKRTGAQRELFADVKGENICTDPTCYTRKADTSWARYAAEAKEDGAKILTDDQAAGLFYDDGRTYFSAPVVDLDAKCSSDPKERTYRKLLGDAQAEIKVQVGRDSAKRVHELADRRQVEAALRAAGHKFLGGNVEQSAEFKAAQREARDKASTDKQVITALTTAVVGKVQQGGPDTRAVRVLLAGLLENYPVDDAVAAAVARRQVQVPKGKRAAQAMPAPDKLAAPEALGWLAELVLVRYGAKSAPDALRAAATAYGVDAKRIEADVRAEARKAAKGKEPPPRNDNAPKAKQAKGAKGKPSRRP